MTSILLAGVSHQWLEEAPSKGIDIGERNEPSKIAASAKILSEDLKTFQDTTFEFIRLTPGDSSNWEEFISLLKSRKWDGISFGGGVRTIPYLGDYFTELIHVSKTEQPDARILFPLLPEDGVPAIRKYLPQAK